MAEEDAASFRSKRWLPIEANPEVMREFAQKLGLPSSANFFDVYGFDEDLLAMVPQPVLAVLLLFPINDASEKYRHEEEERITKDGQETSEDLWFIKQTVPNACGTIGLLHAIGNNREALNLGDGSYLRRLFEGSAELSPMERAKHLEVDTEIEAGHSAAASGGDTAPPPIDASVDLHFVCFICKKDVLYEMDGRKSFPIAHGKSSPDTLLKDAVAVIHQFVERNPESVQFNMIALSLAEPF